MLHNCNLIQQHYTFLLNDNVILLNDNVILLNKITFLLNKNVIVFNDITMCKRQGKQ